MKNIKTITSKLLITLIVLHLFSCKKKKEEDPVVVNTITTGAPTVTTTASTNDVTINITNMADNVILQIAKDTIYKPSTPKYISAYGDTFSVTKFRYYISNIKLKKQDGSYYTETESYHLIDASDSLNTCKFNLKNVPYATYTAIEYMIGVDSTRNCSGAQTGQLDPLKDMYWNWNQGYIFLKFEAYTSSISSFGGHNVEYHVGGFKGATNNIKNVSLTLPSNLVVDNDHISKLFIKANAKECLKTPTTISFATLPTAISPASTKPIANNYTDMFLVTTVIH